MANENTANLKIALFGAFSVEVDGQPLPPTRSVKTRYLLALLCLRGGQEASRKWLAETLWPDSLESDALGSLRQCVADLRRALGAQAARIESPAKNTIRLNMDGADLDVLTFDRAMKRGDRDALAEAAALYRGALLEGASEVWVLGEREARRQAYGKALQTLAAQARAAGDREQEIAWRRRAAASEPSDEGAGRELMQALADAGRAGEALDVYAELRRRLRDEGTIAPNAKTQRVWQAIRDAARGASAKAVKGNASAPDAKPESAPALPALRAREQGMAPLPLTELIGREDLLLDVKAALFTARLVTLTGTGGVGKTRLAVEALADMKEGFADGACFLDLTRLADPARLPHYALTTLGITPEGNRDALNSLTVALRARHLLLVLDNCETALEPCALLAQTLLRASPNLSILATSRQRLGVTGENVIPIAPLPLPEPDDLLANPSARLFVERARALRPDFALTPDNAPDVIALCRRLDGLPLALELAAPLIEALTPRDIARYLSDQTNLLQETDPARPERHQSLRAVIASSAALLSLDERMLLTRLSVFVGGWTLDAVSTINYQPSSINLLRSLIARSLVISEERDGQMRYRMLESIRAYAVERLAQGDEEAVCRDRHLDHFVALAEQAEAELTGPQQALWLEQLETEAGNLRAALQWAKQNEDAQTRGLRLASALGRFWQIRGYFAEGRDELAYFLDAEGNVEPDALRANALNWTGLLSVFVGDLAGARAWCEAGLALWQRLENQAGMASSLGIMGIVAANQNNYDGARRCYGQALEGARAAGDRAGVAGVLGYLGIVAVNQGYYEEAKACYAESLELRRALQDKWGVAASLNNLGLLARKQGDLTQARAFLEEALALRRELRDPRSVGISLNVLGLIAWQQGDGTEARRYFDEALRSFLKLGDRRSAAYALEAFARLAASEGQARHAARLLGAAQRLRQEIASPLPDAEQQELERDTRPARLALGEDVFAAACAQGGLLMPEQAAAETLDPPPAPSATDADSLFLGAARRHHSRD